MKDQGRTYAGTLKLPDHISIRGAESVLDKLREYGQAEWAGDSPRNVRFKFVEGDDWDLHEVLREVAQELASREVDFPLDRKHLSGSSLEDRVVEEAIKLVDASQGRLALVIEPLVEAVKALQAQDHLLPKKVRS